MKALTTIFLCLVLTSSAFATQWTCSAYCVEQNSQDVVMLIEHATFPQGALDAIAKTCAEMNYMFTQGKAEKVILYSSDGEHHEEATVFNSCKQFDPAI